MKDKLRTMERAMAKGCFVIPVFTHPLASSATDRSLVRALAEYPRRNTHQLQAAKVCAGVKKLAESYGEGADNV
jgi:hypothetical protein